MASRTLGANVAASCVAFALLTTAARAEARGVGEVDLRRSDRAAVVLTDVLSVSPGSSTYETAHLSSQLTGTLRLGARLALSLDVASALTSYRLPEEPRARTFRWANPLIGAHYTLLDDARVEARVGVIAGPPLVTVPGTIPANTRALYADTVSAQARGYGGYWLWARNAVPLAILARVSLKTKSGFVVSGSLEPGALLSVNESPSRLALSSTLAVRYSMGAVSPGFRLQALTVSQPLAPNDFAQTAAALFAQLDTGRHFVHGEVSMNLDAPAGPAGVRGTTVWGAAIAAGARF